MNEFLHQHIGINNRSVTRRNFLHTVSASSVAAGTMGFRDLVGLRADEIRSRGRAMILLWMAGGPSQLETFDPKPESENSGPTKVIATAVPGIQIAQGWEQTASTMKEIALIRSMTNKEGSHPRATYQMHTGYLPSGGIKHPSLGACIAKEIGDQGNDLPPVVSVGSTQGAGFLGVDYEPFVVNNPGQLPQNVAATVNQPRYQRRMDVLGRLESSFAKSGGKTVVENHQRLYGKAARLVQSPNVKSFEFEDESAELIDRYGDSDFGRGCLLARRLVEAGVTFIEVVSRGWDTHADNFERVAENAKQVDPALSTLIDDLKDRGLLETTLVVWMGEFGRTPRINGQTGRDHFPRVFNAAMAGAGVRGGQVIGASTADGMDVAERPVAVGDLFCTICNALQIDPRIENYGPLGRPLKIVDGGEPIQQLFS